MEFPPARELTRYFQLQGESGPTKKDGEDPLLYHIRCKVHSHIGFLVEACVEAVPQSILQLVAMQQAGVPDYLSVLSIVLSISCLASKGYVLAFSVHFRTFVFNGICISADVIGMFAAASWLSSPGVESALVATASRWSTVLLYLHGLTTCYASEIPSRVNIAT
jgi:hypothetical protein